MSVSRMIWLLVVERRLAPDVHRRLGAEAEPALGLACALTRSEISSRSPAAAMLAASTVTSPGELPSSGKVLPLSCASMQAVELGERHVDRHRDRRPCPVRCGGTRSSCAGNGQSGLVSVGTMRVSACTPSVRITQSGRMRGCAANALGRAHLEPEVGRARRRLAERDRAAELHPFAARRELERAVVAQLVGQVADLLVDRVVEQRLDFVDDVELEAADLHAAVGDRRHGRRGSARSASSAAARACELTDDVAADVGALVEHARGELLRFAAEVAAEQAADRAGDVAALVGDLAGSRSEPLTVVEMLSAGRHADHLRSGRAPTFQPISALPSRSASGLSRLPSSARGAFASMMSRMASVADRDRRHDLRGARHRLQRRVRLELGAALGQRISWRQLVDRPQRAGGARSDHQRRRG